MTWRPTSEKRILPVSDPINHLKNLKRHLLIHSGVKTYTYSECKKSFGEAGVLRKHMITHTWKKLHKCAQCGDSFGEAGNLKQYMLIHCGEKPHKCPQCDHASAYAGYLREHIRTHYKRPINANGATTLQSQSQILPNMCSVSTAHPPWREVKSV